jgi:hypothetical protein
MMLPTALIRRTGVETVIPSFVSRDEATGYFRERLEAPAAQM